MRIVIKNDAGFVGYHSVYQKRNELFYLIMNGEEVTNGKDLDDMIWHINWMLET